MSLNAMGLGFSFGVEDIKLKDFQTQVSDGFAAMSEKAAKAVDSIKPFVPSFEGVLPKIEAAAAVAADFGDRVAESLQHAGATAMSAARGFADVGGTARQAGVEAADAMRMASDELGVFEQKGKRVAAEGVSIDRDGRARDALGRFVKIGRVFTEFLDHDLPVAAEAASRSYHKETTRILVDSEKVEKIFKSMKDAGNSLKQLVSLSKLQTVFQGIGTGLLAQISKMKQGMGSLLKSHVNLTTNLESEGVQLAKSAKAQAAQMGYSGKEMKKVTAEATGLASGLNIGADVAVKAIYTFNWAQKEFQALGIKTAAQAAKMAESLGLDPQALAGSLRKATQQFGMTADQAAQLTSSLREMGKDGGVASEMVMQLGDVLDSASGATDQFGELLKGDALQQYAMGIVTAGAGLYTFTQDSKQAMDISKSLAARMQEMGDEWNSMMSGAGGAFPEMNQMMMRFGMNVDDTFKMMAGSPEGLVRGLAQLQVGIKKSARNQQEYMTEIGRLRPFLTKALGDKQASDLILRMGQNWEASGDEMMATMDRVRGAKADFGKLADEAHSTGRTLQEQFERMKEAGVMGFRSISREAAGKFVTDTGAAFAKFNAKLQEVASGKGALAEITKKLSLMHQIGVTALIPEALRPMAILFEEIGSQVLPLLGSLAPIVGGLAPALIGMGAPMAAVSVAAGALVIPLTLLGLRLGQLMIDGSDFSDAINQLGEDIQNFSNTALTKLGEGVDWVYEKFSTVDWKGLFGRIFSSIKSVLTGDFDLIGTLFGADRADSAKSRMADIAGKIKDMVVQLKNGFVAAVLEADWGAIGMGLLDKLVYVFIELPNNLTQRIRSIDFAGVLAPMIEKLAASFASGGAGIGNLFLRIFSGLGEQSVQIYLALYKVLETAFELLTKVDWAGVAANLWKGLQNAFTGAANTATGLGEGVWAWLEGAFQWVVSQAPKAAALLQAAIPKIVSAVSTGIDMGGSVISGLQDWVLESVDTLGGWIKQGLEMLWDKVPQWIGSAVDWFSGIDWVGLGGDLLASILGLWSTVITGIPKLWAKLLDAFVGGMTWVLEKIPPAIDEYLPKVLKFIEELPNRIEELLSGEGTGDAAGGFIGSIFGKFGDAIGKFWPVLVSLVTKLVPALLQTVVKLLVAAVPLFLKLMPVLYNIFGQIWSYVMDTAKGFVIGLFDTIGTWLQKEFPALAGPIGVVFDVLKVSVGVVFDVFKYFWLGVVKGFEYLWKGVGWVLEMVWEGLKLAGSTVSWLATKAWDAVKAIGAGFAWVWGVVKGVFSSIYDALEGVFDTVSNVFTDAVKVVTKVFEVIWWIVEPVVLAILKVFTDSFDWIWKRVVEPTTKWIVDKFTWIWNKAKSIFKGVYGTIKSWFDKAYLVISGIFTRIQQMWQSSWNELKTILKSWFDWVKESVEAVKTRLKEVFDGLKTKAEEAMASLKAVLEKPFNVLKDAIKGILEPVKAVFKTILRWLKNLILGAKGLVGSLFVWLLDRIRLIAGDMGFLGKPIVESLDRAKDAIKAFSEGGIAGIDELMKKTEEEFVTSTFHTYVEDSTAKAGAAMYAWSQGGQKDIDEVASAADTAFTQFQKMADALGLDTSGMDPKAVQEFLSGLRADPGSDTMMTSLVQPWAMGTEAADMYASAALQNFAKVAHAAGQFKEMLADSTSLLAPELMASMEARTDAEAGRADRRRRDLEELSQGPMRQLLAATNNPAWYSDWRQTFLKAHEELKAELRLLQAPRDVVGGRPVSARSIPPRDVLKDRGIAYGNVGGVS